MDRHAFDRRRLIAGGALLAGAGTAPRPAAAAALRDFTFQQGSWRVRHRKLRKRLAGSTDWYAFGGTATAGSLMGGLAGYEDNRLDDPAGAYRAEGLRRLDPATGQWTIWWWDSRFQTIDPPVVGRFENGVGVFHGDSELGERPIQVRYIWDMPTAGAPRWRQAFSADRGETWETNWIMEFHR